MSEFEPVPKPEGFEDEPVRNSVVKNKVKQRPTETVTGLGLAAAVYGFLTQAGLANEVAAVISIAVAFAPLHISTVVDAIRGRNDG